MPNRVIDNQCVYDLEVTQVSQGRLNVIRNDGDNRNIE